MKLSELLPRYPHLADYVEQASRPELLSQCRRDLEMRACGFLCCLMCLDRISPDDYPGLCLEVQAMAREVAHE